jgi:hypothetical protein
MNNFEGSNSRKELVEDLKFFKLANNPSKIYLTFFREGKDYLVAMDDDLEGQQVTILDASINQELVHHLEQCSVPVDSADKIVNMAVGEIEYQNEIDSGEDKAQYL